MLDYSKGVYECINVNIEGILGTGASIEIALLFGRGRLQWWSTMWSHV